MARRCAKSHFTIMLSTTPDKTKQSINEEKCYKNASSNLDVIWGTSHLKWEPFAHWNTWQKYDSSFENYNYETVALSQSETINMWSDKTASKKTCKFCNYQFPEIPGVESVYYYCRSCKKSLNSK